MRREIIVSLAAILFLFFIDQSSKLIASNLGLATINQGISFNLLSQQQGVVLIISATLILIGGGFLFKNNPRHRWAIIIILVGAISNLLDRIIRNGVVDWLPIPFLNLKNNFADWLVFYGTVWIIIKELCKFQLFTKTKT